MLLLPARRLVAALLIVAGVLFLVGAVAEHRAAEPPRRAHTAAPAGEATDSDAPPAAGEGEATVHEDASSEQVLGVQLDAPLPVATALGLSVLIAALLWSKDRADLLIAAAVLGAAFAVLDGVELAHQIRESRAGIALLAAAIVLVHLAAALLASRAARSRAPA